MSTPYKSGHPVILIQATYDEPLAGSKNTRLIRGTVVAAQNWDGPLLVDPGLDYLSDEWLASSTDTETTKDGA